MNKLTKPDLILLHCSPQIQELLRWKKRKEREERKRGKKSNVKEKKGERDRGQELPKGEGIKRSADLLSPQLRTRDQK